MDSSKYTSSINLIKEAAKIAIIQAENPDGDSLGSALALEEILSDQQKEVSLYCPVEIPSYLRYFEGWDRVETELNVHADVYVIVDTASKTLLSKVIENPLNKNLLDQKPVVVIDHHSDATPDIEFSHELILESASSAAEVIFNLSKLASWTVNKTAAQNLLGAILSDTLGLSTQNVTPETYFAAGELTKLGASSSLTEEKRREFMKKAPEILKYKGQLIDRIEYLLDNKLALVHIPWEEIRKYSNKYNPSALVIDEMRLVENVEIAIALKTYPDGKLTGKIRTNLPIAADIAGYFGGGGHAYAAGFRVYDEYDNIIRELVTACEKVLAKE